LAYRKRIGFVANEQRFGAVAEAIIRQLQHRNVVVTPVWTNISLKIINIGNSAGVILPKELLAQLRVELGDTL
jgi:hypothetical protein